MKKKIIICSILAVLLMLSIPMISNIQAQPVQINEKTNNLLDIQTKPTEGPFCIWLISGTLLYYERNGPLAAIALEAPITVWGIPFNLNKIGGLGLVLGNLHNKEPGDHVSALVIGIGLQDE
jgi:hypothetical protein